jgi:hypothetical protein
MNGRWWAALAGDLLYPLARTGPVVPAHSGDDQEHVQAEREFLVDALCPALRAPEGAAFPS